MRRNLFVMKKVSNNFASTRCSYDDRWTLQIVVWSVLGFKEFVEIAMHI